MNDINLQPGSFVQISGSHHSTYQVVSIDESSDCCWVRRWPLSRHGSPPFAISLRQVRQEDSAAT